MMHGECVESHAGMHNIKCALDRSGMTFDFEANRVEVSIKV